MREGDDRWGGQERAERLDYKCGRPGERREMRESRETRVHREGVGGVGEKRGRGDEIRERGGQQGG